VAEPVAARAAHQAVAVAAERAEEAQAVRVRRAALPRPQHRQPQQPPRPVPERRRRRLLHRRLPRRHCACRAEWKTPLDRLLCSCFAQVIALLRTLVRCRDENEMMSGAGRGRRINRSWRVGALLACSLPFAAAWAREEEANAFSSCLPKLEAVT